MYTFHRDAVRPLRAIATLIVMTLVLWSLGIMPFQSRADAANLTNISDTLTDTGPSAPSNHTFQFTVPNGVLTGQSIVLNFPAGFTLNGTGATGLDFNDIDVTVGSTIVTMAAASSTTTWGVSTTTSSITLNTGTSSGATVASGTVVTVKIGTNAVVGATGDTRITNPVVGSYELTVNGTMVDNGQTRVAIISPVVVTANVDTSFTFTILGVANGQSVNASPTTTATTTTATSVPFGTLVVGSSTVLAQDLTVTTNAIQGFVVTVQQSQNLLSSTGADIDGFSNGAYTNTPTAWVSPTNVLTNENTWGHWGITSEDDLNTDEFGVATALWVAASTTPRQIFKNAGVADGTTANVGRTRIGYQAQIASLQEAADDYNTTLTYIATPVF